MALVRPGKQSAASHGSDPRKNALSINPIRGTYTPEK